MRASKTTSDPAIAWRATQLEIELRSKASVQDSTPTLDVAIAHLEDADSQIRACARAWLIAAGHDRDVNEEHHALRAEASKTTRDVARSVRAWLELVAPIVAENRDRNRALVMQLVAWANDEMNRTPTWWQWTIWLAVAMSDPTMFPASSLPGRVDRIAMLALELDEVAAILARQLHNPETVPTKRGKPTDHVQREIARILRAGGYTPQKIGELTDKNAGDKTERVRHRLRATRR